MIQVAWLFYFSKFIELLDTVGAFFIFLLLFWPFDQLTVTDPMCAFAGILCAEKETRSDHISPRLPSLLYALDVVVGRHPDTR